MSPTLALLLLAALVLASPGACALDEENAEPACPEGKVYIRCGTACPLTCENYGNPPMCTRQCVPGCFCPPGKVEYEGGCVNPSDCPTTDITCPEGKEFKECGSACPLTCDNYKDPPACIAVCVPGCFCPEGQVEHEGSCVDPDNCPSQSERMRKRVKEVEVESEMMIQRFEKAWSKLDAEGVTACFTEDGMFLAPGVDVLRGRKDIAKFLNMMFQMGMVSIDIESKQIEVFDSEQFIGYSRGYYTFFDKGGDPLDYGKYVSIAKRENGDLKVHVSIFNSNSNPQQPQHRDEL